MTVLYRVSSSSVHWESSLHWSKFFPNKLRHHHTMMSKRQDLILYLANIHSSACKSKLPLGLIHIPMRLTSLRNWVQDYRIVLDKFFEVKQLGFNFAGGKNEVSILVPKRVFNEVLEASVTATSLNYIIPSRAALPQDCIISKVYIRQHAKDFILQKILDTNRIDLYSAAKWLLTQGEVNFHFTKSGKLQLRDTSVWPVQAIETWPSWLREELFGAGLDIEAAYTQFIIQHLTAAHADQPKMLHLLYPDLMRSLYDKKNWRSEICTNILGLDDNEDNIKIVKKLCMCLANGSRISPAILIGSRAFSDAAQIVFESVKDVSLENLSIIGEKLSRISTQYSTATKTVCLWVLEKNPSRLNKKKIFTSYFEWERIARYAIWEACGQHGVMVHDGIDGIPEEYLIKLPEIIKNVGIKITS